MPRARRACAEPDCPTVIDSGSGSRCPVHTRRAPDRRPSAAARGYDRKWAAKRAAYLRAHPDCQHPDCHEPATDVDHIDGRGPNGDNSWSNLRGLCKPHHSQRTARDQPGGWNTRSDPYGGGGGPLSGKGREPSGLAAQEVVRVPRFRRDARHNPVRTTRRG